MSVDRVNMHRVAAYGYAWGYQDRNLADVGRQLTDDERRRLADTADSFADWYDQREPRAGAVRREVLRQAFLDWQRSDAAADVHRTPRFDGQIVAAFDNVVTYLVDNYQLSMRGTTLTRAAAAVFVLRHHGYLDEGIAFGSFAYFVGNQVADAEHLVWIDDEPVLTD